MTLWARDNIMLNVSGERSSPIPDYPIAEKDIDELIKKYKYFATIRRNRNINARKIVNALIELKKYREKNECVGKQIAPGQKMSEPSMT
jgi:hypothetical protein